MTYNGLGGYSREKQDKAARRPGESDIAWDRRRAQFFRADQVEQAQFHRQPTTDDQEWAEHRQAVDNRVGSDTGIFGNLTGQELAAARGLVGAGHGGEQAPEKLGHLASVSVPGQHGAVSRIYASQLSEGDPAMSPVAQYLRSSGEGRH